jgi:DNA-binding transcriptional LysR family regulator
VPEIVSVNTVWSSVILMVQSGAGVSLLPVNHQQTSATDLSFIPLKAKNAFVELCVCWSARRDRPLLRAFRGLTKEHARGNQRL